MLIITGFTRLEKYLNLEGILEKSLKIKSALKSTGKSLQSVEKSLTFLLFSVGLNTADTENLIIIKFMCLYLVQHMLHQIKAQQFYANFLVLMSPLSKYSISEEEF